MNLSDAQGRLARWRLRLAEFLLKVEYHPGAAHHAADALSRLPHQEVPSDPIEEEIQMFSVLSKASKADITLDDPCALEENSASPIEEVPVMPVWEVFDHQCLDPTARLIRESLVTDPSWDHDQNGLLVWRLETGETSLHVPAYLQQPCAVIHAFPEVNVSPSLTASSLPVATDGSALIRGVKDGESTENSFGESTENSFATTPTSTLRTTHPH
jgi:hypothetical protein